MKVYLVSDGEYEDRHIIGVFSTLHKAQVFALRNGYEDIDEYIVDPASLSCEDAEVLYIHYFELTAQKSSVCIVETYQDRPTLNRVNQAYDSRHTDDSVVVEFTTAENYSDDIYRSATRERIRYGDPKFDIIVEKFKNIYDMMEKPTPNMRRIYENLSNMGMI